MNRIDTVTDIDSNTTTYFYNGIGKLVTTEFANGVTENRDYDLLNRLTYLENVVDNVIVSSYTYTLDKIGNRILVEENDGRVVEYDYDNLYRLTQEKINNSQIIDYTYDAVGNRLTKADSVEGTTIYTYNQNDWLLTETGDDITKVYQYDENGNTVKVTQNGQETIYVWDLDDRLIQVQTADGDVIDYTYDMDNIRTSQTVNGVTTNYLLDKNRSYAQVLEEYVDGELGVSYVYGWDLISQSRNDETTFYQVDGLGSTRILTDENRYIVASYDYDAFGSLIDSTGNAENQYLFAGEQFDNNLDEYYLRQRYYNQSVGRFTRRDTYEGDINSPFSLHKYLYGNANPVVYIDPSGLYSQEFGYGVEDVVQPLYRAESSNR